MKKIPVRLKDRSYSILIGKNLLPSIGKLLKRLKLGRKILIVSNARVAKLFLAPVRSSLFRAGFDMVPPYFLKHGNERDKSKESLLQLWEHMAQVGLERSSTVLALGGGVVGDLAGFAASTYMRGIPVVQAPTTLLAQVDAAIGGKTAIDLPLAKNIVGTFHQPRLVISDVATLKRMGLARNGLTEMKNSIAEIIKYGMIADLLLFRLLEQKIESFLSSAAKRPLGSKELAFLETVVERSVRIKARVVAEDERETKGRRMILNYGHTFGHALEAASHYQLPHGEAVALGMVCAARLARKRGIFSARDEERQNRLIHQVGLPICIGALRLKQGRVISAMLLDKKKKGGKPRFILPVAIGRVKVVDDVSLQEIKYALGEN